MLAASVRAKVPTLLEKVRLPEPVTAPLSVTFALLVMVRLFVSVTGALIVSAFVEFDVIWGKVPVPLVSKFKPLPAAAARLYTGDPALKVNELRANVPAMSSVIVPFEVAPKVNWVLGPLVGTLAGTQLLALLQRPLGGVELHVQKFCGVIVNTRLLPTSLAVGVTVEPRPVKLNKLVKFVPENPTGRTKPEKLPAV